MINFSVGELFDVSIEKLSTGGDGIARHQNIVVFVPLTAPGDLVKIKITELKKTFARAELISVLSPSPHRITPDCRYYGRCGGCNWQHLKYDFQLSTKELLVREQFQTQFGSVAQSMPFLPIIQSKNQFGYRNRIQMHFNETSQSGLTSFGFFEHKSHALVEVDKCLIADEKVSDLISKTRSSIETKRPKNNRVQLFLNKNGDAQADWGIEDTFYSDFSQVNIDINDQIVTCVVDFFKTSKLTKFIDLYSGSGNFSFPLYRSAAKVSGIGVELGSKSLGRAKDRAIEENISSKNLKFYCSDVEKWLARNPFERDSFVIVDPPRAGLSTNTALWLGQQSPSRFAYLSCNPSTLARDLKIITDASQNKLRIVHIQPYDMFPQTDHTEVLVFLES
jgi:23S rRNA (uracil1939-C5)-methyltransferase